MATIRRNIRRNFHVFGRITAKQSDRIVNPYEPKNGDSSNSSSDDERDDDDDIKSDRRPSVTGSNRILSNMLCYSNRLHDNRQMPISFIPNGICVKSVNGNDTGIGTQHESSAHITCKAQPISSPSPPPPLAQLNVNMNAHNKSYDNCFDVKQFSRSCIGSAKYLMNAHPNSSGSSSGSSVSSTGHVASDDLVFESRFESGNLAKAIKITPVYYELYLRPDLYTNKHTQWFYFRVRNMTKGVTYRYSNCVILLLFCIYGKLDWKEMGDREARRIEWK